MANPQATHGQPIDSLGTVHGYPRTVHEHPMNSLKAIQGLYMGNT